MFSSIVFDFIFGVDCFFFYCWVLMDIFVNKEMFCWIRQSIFWMIVIVLVFFMILFFLDCCLFFIFVMRYQFKIDLFIMSIVLIVVWSLGFVFGVFRVVDVQYNGQCIQIDGILIYFMYVGVFVVCFSIILMFFFVIYCILKWYSLFVIFIIYLFKENYYIVVVEVCVVVCMYLIIIVFLLCYVFGIICISILDFYFDLEVKY